MAIQSSHQAYSTISAAEFDRIIDLIRHGVLLDQGGLLNKLVNAIGFTSITPALQEFLQYSASSYPARDTFTGDGIEDEFTLSFTPVADSEQVFVDGALVAPTGYTLSGTTLTFTSPPGDTLPIVVMYHKLQGIVPFVGYHVTLPHRDISSIIPLTTSFFVYGVNKSGGTAEVAAFQANDFTQIGSGIDVSSGTPDQSPMTRVGGYIWAAGSDSGTNTLQRIDESTLTATKITPTTDTAVVISSLATDGTYVYAFAREGTLIAPNTVIKLDTSGTVVGLLGSGIGVDTTTDMAVASNGYVYVAYLSGDSVPGVQKFDTNPATGLTDSFTFTNAPTRIIAVNQDIYVLEGTALHKIDSAGTVTQLQTYGFTPSNMAFDGNDLWISSGTTLYKADVNGNTLQTLVPSTPLNINAILTAFTLVYTSYSSDTDINLSRIFPGIPGV